MLRPQTPEGVDRPRLRSAAAAFTSLTALIATSLVAGPASAASAAGPCGLERTSVHHSEGVDTWNDDYPRPLGELRAMMIFLSFPGSDPVVTPEELAADYFPATTHFFERASYGRFTLTAHALRSWVRMPKRASAYGMKRDWDTRLRTDYLRDAVKAADSVVDFARYDVVYLVADPDAPGVDSDATKVVNFDRPLRVDGVDLRRVVTVFEQHPPDQNVLAHETGHLFDLPDLYNRPRNGTGDWDTHVGDWDLMGSQFGLAPEPFGWHKWKLGWLDRDQVDCVDRDGRTVHTLDPLVAPPPSAVRLGAGKNSGRGAAAGARAGVVAGAGGSAAPDLGGKRLLVVRTGAATALAIEVREADGNDAETCAEGVLVYRVRAQVASGSGPIEVLDGHPHSEDCAGASVYASLADAPLGVGERLTDPASGVAVEVLGIDRTGGWVVRVTRQ